MSIVYMDPVTIPGYVPAVTGRAYEYQSSDLVAPGDGDTVMFPTNVPGASVLLQITTGAGKIQTTVNKVADVLSDTDVVWDDWSSGEVASTTGDRMDPVTALKMVNASGTTRLIIRAQ